MTYDPKSALRALQAAMQGPKIVKDGEEPGLVDASGKSIYEQKARPETLCILLAGFAAGTAVLPDDFDNLDRKAKALKAHVRPDGGVYLGAFEMPHDPAGVVVVYGDPLMPPKQAIRASQVFRSRLLQQMERIDQHKALGPFAAPAPTTNTQVS